MRKTLCLLLVAVLILSVLPLGELRAESPKYVLSEGTNTWKFNEATDLIDAVNAIDDEKEYTLTLNADLEIPLDGVELKMLDLKGNMTIKGNNHKLSGKEGASEGFLTKIRLVQTKNVFNIAIENLRVDGSGKYGFIDGDIENLSFGPNEYNTRKLSLNNCNISNCNNYKTGAIYIGYVDVKINNSNFVNCGS